MERQNFLDFTIEGDNLDPITMKEEIGLPCEVYFKGQKIKSESTGREVISRATRWLYSASTTINIKTESFLTEQLTIIAKKMPILKNYIKDFKATLEITIYEEDPKKEYLVLTKKSINLLNKIGIDFLIVFKSLKKIYDI